MTGTDTSLVGREKELSPLRSRNRELVSMDDHLYAEHAPHEAEPVTEWLSGTGVQSSVFRYPLNVRRPIPLDALRTEIGHRRAAGARRIGLIGFSAGGHLAGPAIWTMLAEAWIREQAHRRISRSP